VDNCVSESYADLPRAARLIYRVAQKQRNEPIVSNTHNCTDSSRNSVECVLVGAGRHDTFQPVTPLIDGAVSETLRQFAPSLRDDCTLELLDCSESSPAYSCNYLSIKIKYNEIQYSETLNRTQLLHARRNALSLHILHQTSSMF